MSRLYMIDRLRLRQSGRIFLSWDADGVVVVIEALIEDLEDVVGIVVDLEVVEGVDMHPIKPGIRQDY